MRLRVLLVVAVVACSAASLRCGEWPAADGRYQACNPTKTDCPSGKSD